MINKHGWKGNHPDGYKLADGWMDGRICTDTITLAVVHPTLELEVVCRILGRPGPSTAVGYQRHFCLFRVQTVFYGYQSTFQGIQTVTLFSGSFFLCWKGIIFILLAQLPQ